MNELVPSPVEAAEVLRKWHSAKLSDTDDLLELASRFVDLKQRLGHRYEAPAKRLRGFLRFLHDRGIQRASDLSVDAVLEWHGSRRKVQPVTRMGDVSAVSVFMDHLKAIGQTRNNPCIFLKERLHRNWLPHIFSLEELGKIFHPPKDALRGRKLRALIYYVIYACALRGGEAMRLKMRHFDPDKGILFIEKSKWLKDRVLPLHERVLGRIKNYVNRQRKGVGPEAPLFANNRRRPYKKIELSQRFKHDLHVLGLYRPTREIDGIRRLSTRLHGLRHTFAVLRLLRWYRRGADVQAMLPFLSTYLGHSDVIHTQVYLTITGLILREAHARFSARWEREFPLKP